MPEQAESAVRILLVEDNEVDVTIVERVLSRSGLLVELNVARDGKEALDLLYGLKGSPADTPLPRLILLDLRLPVMDGINVVRRVKKDPELCVIPVAMLTGVAGERHMLECMDAGANMYLTKPISVEDAQKIVDTVNRYWVVMEKKLAREP